MVEKKQLVLRLGSTMIGLTFVVAGLLCFFSTDQAARFAALGFAPWFRFVVGLLEIFGGFGLLMPGFAWYSCGVLALLMIGGAASMLINNDIMQAYVAIGMMVLLFILGILWYRANVHVSIPVIAKDPVTLSQEPIKNSAGEK